MVKKKYEDVKIGNKYGRWTVIGDYIIHDGKHKKWLCECSCKEKTISYVDDYQLKTGKSKSCGCLKRDDTDKYITNLKTTFYDWCVENNHQDLLDRWDYKLNKKSPKEVGINTHNKLWFKCNENDNHKSELHSISGLYKGVINILCRQCNSFGQWCLDNNRKDILDRWDYDKNNLDPFEISKSSGKKCYFKCPKGIHKSELKTLYSLTSGNIDDFHCNACNSFAQWGIDNFGEDFLNKYWDYEKNDKDPWEISYAYNGKVWIKCQEKDYHGSYYVSCGKFSIDGKRCPYCAKTTGKIHKFDSLGYLYPNVLKKWSDKNKRTPYDYSPGSGIKVWFKCDNCKHDDYLRSINDEVKSNFRCPHCVAIEHNSSLQNKVSNYICDKYNYTLVHEFECTINPRNPKTGYILPFDNEIKELRLIIETNGEQHYKPTGFTKEYAKKHNISIEEAFYERQWIDNYKKEYAISNGYYYLEIPYTSEKNDKYKELIDNKIKDILNS